MKNEKNIQQVIMKQNQTEETKNNQHTEENFNNSPMLKKLCSCGSGKDYKDCHGKQK